MILFVCEANYTSILSIKTILRCFELLFWLMVNFHKSMIRAIGVERGVMDNFAKTSNYNQMTILFKHLWLLVGES